MPKYKIKISYSTGNSYHTEDTYDYLELDWERLDVAKENLQRIKEHYLQYQDGYDRKNNFEKNKDKAWFVNVPKLFHIKSNCAISETDKKRVGEGNWEYRIDPYSAIQCLKLKTDIGTEMQMSAFWCGHFEMLYEAEIEVDDTEDGMKITF